MTQIGVWKLCFLDPNLEETAVVDIVRGEGRAGGADLVLGGGCAKGYAGRRHGDGGCCDSGSRGTGIRQHQFQGHPVTGAWEVPSL